MVIVLVSLFGAHSFHMSIILSKIHIFLIYLLLLLPKYKHKAIGTLEIESFIFLILIIIPFSNSIKSYLSPIAATAKLLLYITHIHHLTASISTKGWEQNYPVWCCFKFFSISVYILLCSLLDEYPFEIYKFPHLSSYGLNSATIGGL